MPRISETPVSKAVLNGDEVVVLTEADGDAHATVDKLSTHAIESLTPAATLAKVISAAPQLNGLNANMLEGVTRAFLQNAGNLDSGVVPDAQLPFAGFSTSWGPQLGTHGPAGEFKMEWKVPSAFLGGAKLMIQMGWTKFDSEINFAFTENFKSPFSAGFGGENKALVCVFPEIRSNNWPGNTEVEMDVRLVDSTLTNFRYRNIRTKGSGADYARANWIAFGEYA